jgi:predicted AlkP superfamily phosphohydrolase/phosphomutase
MAKRKLIIIGLDGGTWDAFDPLMQAGKLPNFQAIVERGVAGNLISTIPPITAVAWSSLQTGVNPGKHGLFDSVEYNKNDFSIRLNDSLSIKIQTIWEYLSNEGATIGLVNVPITYPPKKLNGCVIGGFLSPNVDSEFTYPADLYQKMVKDISDYKIFIPVNTFETKGLRGFVDELIYATQKRAEAALWINKKYNPDLLMVHFQDLDALQHKLWGLVEQLHTTPIKEDVSYVLRYYTEMDRILGMLTNLMDENTTTLILSDHGFCKVDRIFFINRWLSQKKLLKTRRSNMVLKLYNLTQKTPWGKSILNASRRIFVHIKGDNFRASFKSIITPDMLYDRHKTKAFAVKASSYAGIFITTTNHYEAFKIKEIIREGLSKIIDPGRNKKIIKHIYDKEDTYSGERISSFPDLIIEPEKGYVLETKITANALFRDPFSKNLGNHAREGILVALGKDIRSGKLENNYSIIDMAASIIHLMGKRVPEHLESNIIHEIFTDNYEFELVDEMQKTTIKDDVKKFRGRTKEEYEAVYARLKDLGYID